KHRALDLVRRERTARTFAPELARMLDSEWTLAPAVDEAFAGHAIRDEQLRMMFSCCHPRLPRDSQVALILNILCGFGSGGTAAVAGLMWLPAARLPARLDAEGGLNPLAAQDRSRWDAGLVARGLALLDRSATGSTISAYHLEAAIAAEHAAAQSTADTNWSV